ncbi:MAG: KilA-N domain-containing protein [Butyrivibrio sp.]|nr:KilA-N domain-containing protein [Butyrivibrio sp.]
MSKTVKKDTIHALGIDIGIYTTDFKNEFISLTDIARYRSIDPRITIHNWLRGRDVVEFLGLWEVLHNPDFKRIEFDAFKEDAGTNAYVFSIKDWTDNLGAIGLFTKSGRYGGGIYAHIDIAFEFASWISPEFKLYIIKDYQRLKSDENSRLSLNWNLNREIAKLNYRIHTDAIKDHLIPPELTLEQISYKYANEADMLNVVLFGKTAKQWRDANPGKKGNIRDDANLNQLLVLANMESYNAILIGQGKTMSERIVLLRELAVKQMETLSMVNMDGLKHLPGGDSE